MPLTPLRFLKKLFMRKKQPHVSMQAQIQTREDPPPDVVGKMAYWLPPWAQGIDQHMGKARITYYDAVNNHFYFDKPMPLCVEKGWRMVIADA